MIIVDALNYAYRKGIVDIDDAITEAKRVINILKREDKKVIFVFDGYRDAHPGGESIVWAGINGKADDWILRFIKEGKKEVLYLVSRDKALVNRAKHFNPNVVVWDPVEFERYINDIHNRRRLRVIREKIRVEASEEERKMLETFDILEIESMFRIKPDKPRRNLRKSEGFEIPLENFDYEKFFKKYEEEIEKKR